MKVAINHTQFSSVGGSERYIYYLVQRLLDDGHEVHYFCNRVRDTLEHQRLRFHHVPRVRGVRFWKVLSFARHSARMLRAAGPFDVIHGFSKTYYQDVYTDGSGLQSVYREHTLTRGSRLRRWLQSRTPYQLAVEYCERERFRRGNFTKILTMSRMVKEQIQSAYGLDDREVEVLYNGIACEDFNPALTDEYREHIRRQHKIDAGAYVVLFVGSDYERKNLVTLIRAAAELTDVPELRVVVCGRDRHAERYVQLAGRLGVGDKCLFLGMQKNIAPYFGAADVLALPTFYDVFGMVVLEAMASGVPPIVSRRAGASEIITPGENGAILEEPSDAAMLASLLRKLREPGERDACRRAARRAAEAYAWDRHMKRLYAVYEGVARERR